MREARKGWQSGKVGDGRNHRQTRFYAGGSRCGGRSNRPRRLSCRCGCMVDWETLFLPRIVELGSESMCNVLHKPTAMIPLIPGERLARLQSQTTFPASPYCAGTHHSEVAALIAMSPYTRAALETSSRLTDQVHQDERSACQRKCSGGPEPLSHASPKICSAAWQDPT